jgi:hypothetical protein
MRREAFIQPPRGKEDPRMKSERRIMSWKKLKNSITRFIERLGKARNARREQL